MSPSRRILIVEDDQVLRRHLRILLEAEGYRVEDCGSINEARTSLTEQGKFSAFIIDWALPDGEGSDFISAARAAGTTIPMILLTARANVTDKVLGLKLGASDYMVKPFEPLELLARLDRHISFYEQLSKKDLVTLIEIGDITVDQIHHRAYWRGDPVELTRLQFALLLFLLRAPDRVFSRDELLNEVWGFDKYPTTRTVDNHIVQLRQKFSPDYFLTVHGLGYKFVAPKKTCH